MAGDVTTPDDNTAAGDTAAGQGDYAAAVGAIDHAIDQLKRCTDEERSILRADLEALDAMARKLDAGRVEIVVFGEISTGKSALINALIGEAVADVDIRGGWTKEVWHLKWEGSGYRVPGFAGSSVVLVDTPGLNEVEGQQRATIAREAAQRADLILFVTDSDLNETEYSALVELAASHKPILLVLNKVDLYRPEQRDKLLELFRGERLAGLVDPPNVIVTAAHPKEVEYVIESPDGSTRSEWRTPQPDVGELRARVLEVLETEGKALVALNGAMYAADKSDRVAALRVRMREDRAQSTIWSYAVMKALAVAVNPAPVGDVIGGSLVDITMILSLAKVYGIELTRSGARELVTAIIKAAGWVIVGEALTHIASWAFVGLTLGYGKVLTALPQGAAAGYGSYIVGQSARYYFEHGASWGDEAPKTVVTRILAMTDKESVLERLKGEIRGKLQRNVYAGRMKDEG